MHNLSSSQWEQINEIVLGIYSEKDLYKMRINLLKGLEKLIPHDISFFDLGYKKNTQVVFFDPATYNIEDYFMKAYFGEYESIDNMLWFFSQNNTDIYRESDYITPAMLESSVFYNEWMKPQNVRHGMGSRVGDIDLVYGSVNLWRSEAHGDFTDMELEILRVINPHLVQYFHNRYPNGIRRNSEHDYADTLITLYNLTDREAEIVDFIYQGKTSKEISEALFISENTVKKHTYNIFKKMNAKHRSQVIKIVHNFMNAAEETLTGETMQKLDKDDE